MNLVQKDIVNSSWDVMHEKRLELSHRIFGIDEINQKLKG